MTATTAFVFLLVILAAIVVGAAAAWSVFRRHASLAPAELHLPAELIEHAVGIAVAQANERANRERDQSLQSAFERTAVLNREQIASQTVAAEATLVGRHQQIDQRLGDVQAGVQADIDRLARLVQQLNESTSERFGQVDQSLRVHSEITQTLSSTTQSLREALASPNSRGQWGERMAEDIIRAAGLIEHKQYCKRTALTGDGNGIPDFTFFLPKGHVLFMDVKFPMAAYLRYLDANTHAEQSAHRATFLRDVRQRVRELAKREYAKADQRPSIDNVLLFVPNETLSGFIHENDPDLIDEAMRQNVVICSPLTLFAYLGVVRQAFDNFMIEQTSQEILGLLATFGQQWGKYTETVDKVKRQFDTVSKSFDELATTRKRALERPLKELDALRLERGLPIEGELFGAAVLEADVLEMEGYRELGA